jgi:hypothetical protein
MQRTGTCLKLMRTIFFSVSAKPTTRREHARKGTSMNEAHPAMADTAQRAGYGLQIQNLCTYEHKFVYTRKLEGHVPQRPIACEATR